MSEHFLSEVPRGNTGKIWRGLTNGKAKCVHKSTSCRRYGGIIINGKCPLWYQCIGYPVGVTATLSSLDLSSLAVITSVIIRVFLPPSPPTKDYVLKKHGWQVRSGNIHYWCAREVTQKSDVHSELTMLISQFICLPVGAATFVDISCLMGPFSVTCRRTLFH